jgi:hypothetical protein
MAVFDTAGSDYTRTGNGGLTRFANTLSYFPFVSKIPVFGTAITAFIGYVDTAFEAFGWLMKGKIFSAATVATAGLVSNTVNAFDGITWGALNIGSGLATGQTIGTHGRKLTESIIGGVTGALGMKPEVLKSYSAGIGYIGGNAMPSGPGKFASQVAGERGRDANEMYAAYQRGEGGAHINELQSANVGR